ncbi:acyl-CoA dehydrogenase [Streptomyces sp. NPDC006610]|uniref:acyl-CoA dehydrogenase family protein n=1 Tax=Streptomyces sp. NPDC006610 TaxID=3154584 RepID=UPI0033B625F7
MTLLTTQHGTHPSSDGPPPGPQPGAATTAPADTAATAYKTSSAGPAGAADSAVRASTADRATAAGRTRTPGRTDTHTAGTADSTGATRPAGPARPSPAPARAEDWREGDPLPGPDLSIAGELTRVLFGDDAERERLHTPWQNLIAEEAFRHDPRLTPAEHTAHAYQRLRLINDTLDDPEDLARDPALLASLHEWTAILNGGGALCTVASIHYNLFLGSLLDHDHAHRDLSDYTTLRRIGTFLCTEADHGNDAAHLETTARLDRRTGDFVLHTPHPGAQKFMPNTSLAGGPKTAVVAARLHIDDHDHGIYLFLTPLSDENGYLPGIHVTPLPLRPDAPVDHCLTRFDHVRLPHDALLQADHGRLTEQHLLTSTLGNRRKRFLTSIQRVTTGKLCMSAAATGATRAALAVAVRHGQTRHTTGVKGRPTPLNAHRAHHAPLITATATAYAMTLLHRHALAQWQAHTPDTRDHAEHLVALTKGFTTWNARTIALECRERCGAHALLPDHPLAHFTAYIEGTITAEGDNQLIYTKAAAQLLTHHAPTLPPPTDPAALDLTNPHHLRDLLHHLTAIWHRRAHTALRTTPHHRNPTARWNATTTAALTLTHLTASLRAADALLAGLHRTAHAPTRTLLSRLTALYLLTQLTPHTGDLLADQHLAPHHVHRLPHTTDTLTHHLAPHLATLTHAYDHPQRYLEQTPVNHT